MAGVWTRRTGWRRRAALRASRVGDYWSVGSTDEPRLEVPPALELSGELDADDVFHIVALGMPVPGSANTITGSDIVASLTIDGAFEGDVICARVSGMDQAPANIDLSGSTLSGIPYDGGELPAVEDADCSR